MNVREVVFKSVAVALTVGGAVAGFAEEEILENPAFEQIEADGKAPGWGLSGCFRAVHGEGHNGNGGLVWQAAERQGKLHTARQVLKGVKAGDTVKMSALVRKEGFKTDSTQGAVMSIEWHDKDDKWIKALYAITRFVPDGEWTPIQATGLMPANAKSAVMVIYVSGDSVGKVSWDNILVSRVEAEPVSFVTTSVYRNLAADGTADFHAAIAVPDSAAGKRISAKFVWKDAAGELHRDPAARLTKDEAFIELDVGRMAMGTQTVACGLYADDERIGQAAVEFTRVAKVPDRHAWIDKHGRCIVDGKPFFPLGMYWNPGTGKTTTPEDGRSQLDWFTNGPFNCVIHYEMMDRQRLDFCQSVGLKTMIGIDPKIRKCLSGKISEPYSLEEAKRRLSEHARKIKDHPALLGWYIGDEVDAGGIPLQRTIYRTVAAADEHHPIYCVQDRTYDLRPFSNTMDVLGLDPYPVVQKPVSEVTKMLKAGRREVFDTLPLWGVPQAFDWAWYRPGHEKIERFPTLAEMRSMNWQFVANGAKGLFLFAYHCNFYPLCRDDWRPRFALVCEAAREVKKMSEVILSVESAPKATPNSEDAVCRTWVKDGKAYLLVCNLSEKPLDVAVALDSGAWRMSGTEVGTPATMKDARTVAFYLDPIGVSLVRLDSAR